MPSINETGGRVYLLFLMHFMASGIIEMLHCAPSFQAFGFVASIVIEILAGNHPRQVLHRRERCCTGLPV